MSIPKLVYPLIRDWLRSAWEEGYRAGSTNAEQLSVNRPGLFDLAQALYESGACQDSRPAKRWDELTSNEQDPWIWGAGAVIRRLDP